MNPVCIVDSAMMEMASSLSHPFYVRCPGWQDIERVAESFSGNPLYEGVIVALDAPLCFVPFSDSWRGQEVILEVASIGSLRSLLSQMELLKSLRLRLCFKSTVGSDVVKVLASSGIWCSLDYRDAEVDWRVLSSVAEYALSDFPAENRIEPFATLVNRYRPEIGTVIPRAGLERFDAAVEMALVDGEVAIVSSTPGALQHLDVEDYAGVDFDWLSSEDYNRTLFSLQDEECRGCEAFRLCRSTVSPQRRSDGSCRRFFSRLMDMIELRQGACGQ